jgi:hypothetical protein
MTTETESAPKRARYGQRTLQAAKYVSRWPGSTSNDVVSRVGANRASGQHAVSRALHHGLIENRGTPRRFALYLTPEGQRALEDAWPLFSDDAAAWRPGDDLLDKIDALLSQQ